MRVAVVGTGYVGLVSGACMADLGHHVTCIDVDAEKIARLEQGILPIYEAGLEELVKRNALAGRLRFTTSFADGLRDVEVISIAVGTPALPDGSVDMRFIYEAAKAIGANLSGPAVIATKSTVPVGTSERITEMIRSETSQPCDVVSNPEFLREGHAVQDFMHPSRIVIGTTSPRAKDVMKRLYASLDCPKLVMDPRSAEITKYAANAFLATKISFINEMSHLCEHLDADVEHVAHGIGFDPRIGRDFLRPGPGWGGSCFPKDVRALQKLGESFGHELPVVNAAIRMNELARSRIVDRLVAELDDVADRIITFLGITFKSNTDDTRESASVELMHLLRERGARLRAYDPIAQVNVAHHGFEIPRTDSPYEAATGAHAIVITTEWEEFRTLDLARLKSVMAGNVLMDARNLLHPETVVQNGFRYLRIGRKAM